MGSFGCLGSPSKAIEVTDIKNDTTTSYDSMSAAAIALNINIVESLIILFVIKWNHTKEDILLKSQWINY